MKLSTKQRYLLRYQEALLVAAVVVYALLTAVNVPVLLLSAVVSAFVLGNFMLLVLEATSSLYWGRRFPYNWLAYVPLLLITAVVAVTLDVCIIWRLMYSHAHFTFVDLWPSWRFTYILTICFGIVWYAVSDARRRLEQKNEELEQAVSTGNLRLEMQEQELQRAREIQESLLPAKIPQLKGFQIAGTWRPARIVGGDYFDVIEFPGEKLGICIADVAGKGVSAALLMANVQAVVHAFAAETLSPAQLCTRINQVLCGNIADDKFVTFFYGILDGCTGVLQYCNAGHPPPILFRSNGDNFYLREGGLVLGVSPGAKYDEGCAELAPGDRLLAFTDGITEAEAADSEEYGTERIEAVARNWAGGEASELICRLMEDTARFCGSQFRDDATVIVVAAFSVQHDSRECGVKLASSHSK